MHLLLFCSHFDITISFCFANLYRCMNILSTSRLSIETWDVRAHKHTANCRQTLLVLSNCIKTTSVTKNAFCLSPFVPDFNPVQQSGMVNKKKKKYIGASEWLERLKRRSWPTVREGSRMRSCARSAEWRAAAATTAILEQPRRKTLISGIFFLINISPPPEKTTPPGWQTTEEDGHSVTWPRLTTTSRCGAEVAHGLHPLSDCWSSDYYARRRQLKVTKLGGIYLPPCVCVRACLCFCVCSPNGTPFGQNNVGVGLLKVRPERGHLGSCLGNLCGVMEPQLMDGSRSKCIPAGTWHQIPRILSANVSRSHDIHTVKGFLNYMTISL